jgi:osmoprotectant transport system ATP-binding protein
VTAATPGAAVSFESADVWVDSQRLVGPLTLDVARSETLVLLGRSGSGKTTTLRLVNGLLTPSHGTVLVEGRATSAWDPIRLRRRIGYVIQDIGLFPHLTVADNVAIVPRLERWSAERIEHRVPELLDLVGLAAEEYGARHPHQLSGGQRQRVGVARALAADPPILLCDEPFGAVDPITRADLQREFSRLTHALDKTVLFVTHDVREALIVGTRIALFEDGQIVFLGSVAEFRDSADPHVQAFMESA